MCNIGERWEDSSVSVRLRFPELETPDKRVVQNFLQTRQAIQERRTTVESDQFAVTEEGMGSIIKLKK